MIDAISTLTSGLQKASNRVDQASSTLANPRNFSTTPATPQGTASALAAQTASLSVEASETLSQGSLEAATISLKIAADSYKANAQALVSILETQQESFDKIL